MAFEIYVVEHANQMHELLVKAERDPEIETESVVEASIIGCRTLTELASDREFRLTGKKLEDPRLVKRGNTAIRFQRILDDFDRLDHFFHLEREVLLKGGMSSDLVERLIDQCRESITSLRSQALPSDKAIEALRTLRDQACDRSRILKAQRENAKRVSAIESTMWKITLGLCGAGLIGLNAALSAKLIFEAAGFDIVGGALSAAFGGAILKSASTSAPKTITAGAGA